MGISSIYTQICMYIYRKVWEGVSKNSTQRSVLKIAEVIEWEREQMWESWERERGRMRERERWVADCSMTIERKNWEWQSKKHKKKMTK